MSEVTVAPPQYRRFSSVRLGQAPTTMTTQGSPADLPPYSRRRRDTVSQMPRREPVAHTYQLVSGSKAWAVWKVVSSAKSSKSLPTFYEKETITGTLSLDVDRFESIQAIYVTVTGRIITGAGSSDSYTFLNTSVPIWSKVAAGVKLQGSSTWPFSVPLPKTVSIPSSSGGSKLCPLPETFMERGMMASIQYDLTLRIARGKLRADSTLTTPFGYVPNSKPESPSMLRQLAYEEGCPTIPGPDVDPEGWRTLPTVPVAGTLFNSRQLEARCNIAIAKPLCYTRGSVIPCTLSMDSLDVQALDLLATSKAIVVNLRRTVRYYNSPSPLNKSDVLWRELSEDVGRAVWWPSVRGRGDDYIRYLEGEIQLAKDLKPSASIAHFSVCYSVVVCPFDSPGFISSTTEPLHSEPVEIATMYARGPKPRSYAPPAYSRTTQRNEEFYATMCGFPATLQ
ncbi:hypothetical protein EYR36_008610 [Pleurotus pulmonarius]|nr:hypothetical protein EYR36_008610 [Pleurotus pulmonarius]